jgi:hypothetical protein
LVRCIFAFKTGICRNFILRFIAFTELLNKN